MELLEILKQFKKIEPDPAFTATSKRALFARMPADAPTQVHGVSRVRNTIFKILETGAAVALTGFFILLITGAFSGTGLAPQYSAVNPDALRAEAQAVDIQIKLASVNYVAPAAQSTVSGPVTAKNAAATQSAAGTVASTSTSTATSTMTIDQVLQNLAQ